MKVIHNLKKIVPLAFILFIGLQACLNDKGEVATTPDVCDTLTVSYQDSIVPILTVHCTDFACHVSGGTGPGDFTTYAALKAVVDNGLLNQHLFILQDMPQVPAAALSDQQKQLFECWINAGGPNN